MVGVRGGLIALQSLWTIKKGPSRFNIQLNELFLEVSATTSGHLKISIRCITGKYEV